MAKNKTYTATLVLADVEHLFKKPDVSPLSENYRVYSYTSGIEFLSKELYADPSQNSVKLNLQLPAEKITPGLDARIKAGIERYTMGRLLDVRHDIHATRWRGLRASGLAIVALFVLIGASRLIYDSDNLFNQVISEGLSIAAWVGLWVPLEMLVFKIWEHRLDKKVYTLISEMDITISPID